MKRKKRVLIVDDDPGVLTQMRWALQDDFDLILARSPHEAQEVLMGTVPVAAAVVDLHLPPDTTVIDGGLEMIRSLKGARAEIRIIAMTANKVEGAGRRVLDAGATTLLDKPVARLRLLNLLGEPDQDRRSR